MDRFLLVARNVKRRISSATAGAIDLASIMVGVLVLAMLSGVIAVVVFAVIPWSQDAAAKADLSAVASAEGVLAGQTGGGYGDYTALWLAKLLADDLLNLCITTTGGGTGYVGIRKSATGAHFQRTSVSADVVKVPKSSFDACAMDRKALSSAAPDNSAILAMTLNTNLASCTTFLLPVWPVGTTVNVDWGDGSPIEPVSYGLAPHTFAAVSTSQKVTVTGAFRAFGLQGQTPSSARSTQCITSVDRWGAGTLATSAYQALYLSPVTSVVRPPSTITNMAEMFRNARVFDQDVSSWDTGRVTSMSGMFSGATAFNNGGEPWPEEVGSWSTTNVVDLSGMFLSGRAFNQDVSSWDTGRVASFSRMFSGSDTFDNGGQPLPQAPDHWGVSEATTLYGMFSYAPAFNQDVSSWDTGKVTTVAQMFAGGSSFTNAGQPLPQVAGRWNMSSVTTIRGVFKSTSFNQDISGWDTSKVTNMSEMFAGDVAFTNAGQPLLLVAGEWNTANVTDMSGMFYSTNWNPDISSWDTSKVTNMSSMFNDSGFNRDVSSLDTSKVTNMSGMFTRSGFSNGGQLLTPTVGGWDTANVTSMRSMFSDNVAFNQDISGWDTSKVTDMSWMFKGAKTFNNGGQPFLVAEGRWSTAQITTTSGMAYMFFDSFAFKQDLSGWPITFSGTPTSFGMLQGGVKPVWH